MITKTLLGFVKTNPDSIFLISHSKKYSYKYFYSLVQSGANFLNETSSQRVYFYAHDSAELLALVFASEMLGKEVCILNRSYHENQVIDIINNLGQGLLIQESDYNDFPKSVKLSNCFTKSSESDLLYSNDGRIIILTTGTTGTPKAALYSWHTLFSQTTFGKKQSKANEHV